MKLRHIYKALWLLLLLCGIGPAVAEVDGKDVLRVINLYQNRYDASVQTGERFEMAPGETYTISMRFLKGLNYWVASVGDRNVVELNLSVVNEAGKVLFQDKTKGATAEINTGLMKSSQSVTLVVEAVQAKKGIKAVEVMPVVGAVDPSVGDDI